MYAGHSSQTECYPTTGDFIKFIPRTDRKFSLLVNSRDRTEYLYQISEGPEKNISPILNPTLSGIAGFSDFTKK